MAQDLIWFTAVKLSEAHSLGETPLCRKGVVIASMRGWSSLPRPGEIHAAVLDAMRARKDL